MAIYKSSQPATIKIQGTTVVDLTSTSVKASVPIDANSQKITNLAAPSDGGDAVNKTTLDAAIAGVSGVLSVSGSAPISSTGGTTPVISISAATSLAAGSMSASDKSKLDGLPSSAPSTSLTLTAGAGLTGGGNLSTNRTFNVVANADGSIVVNADDIQVGTINDTQHGTRGGGTLHAAASTSTAGFMSSSDKTKLDGITAGAAVASVSGSSPISSSGGASPTISFSIASQAQGDIVYYNGSAWTRLGAGTNGQVLTSGGASANPSWTTPLTSAGLVSCVEFAIGTSASYSSSTVLASTAKPIAVYLQISTAYTAGTTISIGYSGSASALMATADNLPGTLGIYKIDLMGVSWNGSGAAVLVTIGGSPSAGVGLVRVVYANSVNA